MKFDARTAKSLKPGEHLTIDGYPGLRLKASQTTRTWIYRYKSPVDEKMRQVKIGRWPAMSMPAAIVAWEELRTKRDAGTDLSMAAKGERKQEAMARATPKRGEVRTVGQVCAYYLERHIRVHRAKKGQREVERIFSTMLGDLAEVAAADVTRGQAYDLIQSFTGIPVQAQILRRELGAAWECCLDAGKLPENTPNWWRLILRGKLKSKGKTINRERRGVVKRALSPDETGVLINWLPNFSRDVDDALTLYLWTATRGVEIMAIEGADVSEEDTGLWWTIPLRKIKMRRNDEAMDHRVPLIGRAEAIIRRRMALYGSGWLFPSIGASGHREQKNIQTTVYYHQPYSETRPDYVRPRLPVTHWAPHDLRRTSRTFLAMLGCPHDVGEAILGHKVVGVAGVYNRYTYDAERRQWLKRLSEYLEGLALKAR